MTTASPMAGAIIKIAANFVETTIDDEAVVMDIRSGNFFSLTGTALHVWGLIDGMRDSAAIVAALQQNFPDTDAQKIAIDVEGFLDELGEADLVSR
jgi:hypothetical protein